MEQLVNSIGLLGSYFAILLLLAVAVESVLDVIKRIFGDLLHLRATVSPDQLAKDVSEWIPKEGQAAVKAAAISGLLQEVKAKEAAIQSASANIKKAITELVTWTTAANSTALQADNASSIAGALAAIRKNYDRDESNRVIALRLISAAIGIVIAFVLQIDILQLLAPTLSAGLVQQLGSTELLKTIVHIGGIVLTGFGASAGSSFWHDQLDKVRAVKETMRSVDDLRLQVGK